MAASAMQSRPSQTAFKKKEPYSHINRLSSEDLSKTNVKKAKSKQLKDINNFKCCQFCGTEHWWGAEFCPAYGATCNNCQMKNHFTNVCKKQTKIIKAKSIAKIKSNPPEKTTLGDSKDNKHACVNKLKQQSKSESLQDTVQSVGFKEIRTDVEVDISNIGVCKEKSERDY